MTGDEEPEVDEQSITRARGAMESADDPAEASPEPDDEDATRATAIARAHEGLAVQRRQWMLGAALVAVALVACVTVVAVGGRGDGIEVVETGFSVVPGQIGPEVSYGVVIENTRAKVAYHTVICVRLQTESDAAAGCTPFAIEVLLPGQRVGFGATPWRLSGDEEVTGVSVEIRPPAAWAAWAALAEPGDEYGELFAEDVRVAHSPDNHPAVSFEAQSTYRSGRVRNANAYAVFRDAHGDVIGGIGTELDSPVLTQTTNGRRSILLDTAMPGLASAEVYLFPSGF